MGTLILRLSMQSSNFTTLFYGLFLRTQMEIVKLLHCNGWTENDVTSSLPRGLLYFVPSFIERDGERLAVCPRES